MRLLMDAQLPPGLARWLVARGFPAAPVRELGLRDSDDGSIRNFATKGNWAVVTKDEDFAIRCLNDPASPSVVWLRIGNCTNRVLYAWLEPMLPDIKARLAAGEKLIEIRSKI